MILMEWMKDDSWSRYNEDTDEYELTTQAPAYVQPAFEKYILELREQRRMNPNLVIEPI